ncbi:MAG TPA: PDZ domain-containing protein [Steroidobacteraceae bacterium]
MKLLVCLVLCAAAPAISLRAVAAGPPLLPLPLVPNTAQERLQTQIMIQQAQAQARLAADQARAQARLDANQARLEGQVAAQEARAQAQLGAQQRIAASAPIVEPPLAMAGSREEPSGRPAGMELITLTPQLGRYFGTDHGVLVARAPARGILKLQDGDVILSIGDRTPASSSQAMRILTSYDPGEKITLVILREHHRKSITAIMPTAPPVER